MRQSRARLTLVRPDALVTRLPVHGPAPDMVGTKRQSGGYVVPAGTRQATCPKCLAKI